MADQAQVGPQGTALLGNITNLRAGGQADLIVSELHARGYESTLRGHRFGAAMQAVLATATVAGLTTTLTGAITLYNPVTSPVNLVVEKFGIGFVLAPAAPLVYGLATGQSQTAISGTLTALTPKSKNVSAGVAAGVGIVYSSASLTLPVQPTVDTVLGTLDQGAVTVTNSAMSYFDLNGSLIIGPGSYACFWTSAVLLASAYIASFEWEEVPLSG